MLYRILGPLEMHPLDAGKPATVPATLPQQPNARVAVDHSIAPTWPGPATPPSAGARPGGSA